MEEYRGNIEFEIVKINDESIVQLEELSQNALEDGYRIVRKTIDQWIDGSNRFSDKREVLYGIKDKDKFIAIGGFNVDPYIMDDDVGRVRHIYVHTDYRNQGIATFLFQKIMNEKAHFFKVVRLSTKNEAAMELYESYGFRKVVEFKATHIKIIKK